jgi:hypothetical protein
MRLVLQNQHVRAMDRFFNRALDYGMGNPFAVMDRMLDSLTVPVPPTEGAEFTTYKMVPTTYRTEHEKDDKGNITVKYIVVEPEEEKEVA